MLESMCQGGFLSKNHIVTRKFLKDLVEKTIQWETIRDDGLSSRISSAKASMHLVSNLSHIQSMFVALENEIKRLTI